MRKSLFLLSLAVLIMIGVRPAVAQSDQDNTAHIGWNWLKKISAKNLQSYLVANNARITDLQAIGSGGSFNAVVVSNSGSYQKSWQWFAKMTGTQALNYALAHNLRITVVAPYQINGNLYVAVAMIANTGADAAAWDIYYSGSATAVYNAIVNDGDRPIQFKPYGITSTGTSGYIGVGVHNDGRAYAALVQATEAQVNTQVSAGYRVVELMPDYNGTFTAIFDNLGVGWYYWYYVNSDFLWGTTSFYSVRPISIAPIGSLFDAVEIQN